MNFAMMRSGLIYCSPPPAGRSDGASRNYSCIYSKLAKNLATAVRSPTELFAVFPVDRSPGGAVVSQVLAHGWATADGVKPLSRPEANGKARRSPRDVRDDIW